MEKCGLIFHTSLILLRNQKPYGATCTDLEKGGAGKIPKSENFNEGVNPRPHEKTRFRGFFI
jgi:hypothetical protein